MKTSAALVLVLASSTAVFAADNESFIAQVGAYNEALSGQAGGNNTQSTVQAGVKNRALTSQANAKSTQNKSGIVQLGARNNAVVG